MQKISIIVDEKGIANIMRNYFINITKNLNLKILNKSQIDIDKFENQISIKIIHETFPEIIPGSVHFEQVFSDIVRKEIRNLNVKKSSTYGSIPASILKQCVDAYLPYLTVTINYSLRENIFPEELKRSEVIPLYKKLDPLKKENYRPVSLLPHVSKVFERIIYKQINTYMEDKLSKYLTGFRKSHGTQHLLVTMLEKWKKAVDNGEYVSALFLDLSKAFDTINHDLLLAKLKAYGFSPNALKLMHSYLNNRKQQVQINNKFSSESTVIAGVPQGSIDGPLLFNLFINDLVFFIQYCTLSNYADDNNLFSIGKNKDQVKTFLSSDFKIINNWFYENVMILNPEKSHIICIGRKIDDAETLNFNNLAMKNSKEVEVLGITLDRNMNFHNHIKNICRKAGQKLSALLTISQ